MDKLKQVIGFGIPGILCVFLISTALLNVAGFAYRSWVNWTMYILAVLCILLCIGYTIYKCVRYFKRNSAGTAGKIAAVFGVLGVLAVSGVGWIYFTFYAMLAIGTEYVMMRDNQKIVVCDHSFLFAENIQYYEYKNFLITGKRLEIGEDYTGSISS